MAEQLLEEYSIAIKEFRRFLDETNSETLQSVIGNAAYFVQHTIGHIGMVIRLQILYINHNLNKF